MDTRARLPTALFLLTFVAAACTPQETVRLSPSPTVTPTTAPATSAPATRTPSPPPTAPPSPTPTRSPSPTTSPGSTPPTACPETTGGAATLGGATVKAIRAAGHPGYDRLVIEFAGAAVPAYRIAVASTFIAPSGQAVPVSGNAFFSVRVSGQAHTDAGQRSYDEPDPYRPSGTTVIREVKLVEDFEGVVIFGVGLGRLACPTVSTVLGPPRLILDFPTPTG